MQLENWGGGGMCSVLIGTEDGVCNNHVSVKGLTHYLRILGTETVILWGGGGIFEH
jgi:hypothetical protein